jgi:hypothetical protein
VAVIPLSAETVVPEKGRRRNRIILLVVCILLLILGLSAILGGVVIFAFNQGTDRDGFALSNVYEVRSSACAFALWVAPAKIPSYLSWMGTENLVETKWVVESVGSSKELFVGWTKAADGESYVSSFMFETPPNWNWFLWPYSPEINVPSSAVHNMGAPSRSPAEEPFWLSSDTSSASVELPWSPVWDIEDDRNILIIMNADGSSDVEADVQLGFKVPMFGWLPYLLIPVGAVLVFVVVFLFRRKKIF